jgi:hypothetical protein
MCEESSTGALAVTRKARALVREHKEAVLHALWCEKAGTRTEALALLYAAGYTEDDYLQEVWDGLATVAAG